MRNFIGIDVGGTAIKYGLLSESGEILFKKSYPAYFDNYATSLLSTLKSSVRDFYNFINTKDISVDGIAMSVTGDIDCDKNLLVGGCGSIPNWENIHLDEEVIDAIQRFFPISTINDANAAALAESWLGSAKGYKNAIVYTIGTGIGGGIIVYGHILKGARGFAGNIGHMAICSTEQNCHCGNNGCFEFVASTRALLKKAKNAGYDIDGEELFESAKNDEVLKALVDEFFHYHGIALASLIHIFNPEAIVIGGGISAQGDWFVERIKYETKKHTLPHFFENVDFKIAHFSNDAGILGAVKYFLDKEKSNENN